MRSWPATNDNNACSWLPAPYPHSSPGPPHPLTTHTLSSQDMCATTLKAMDDDDKVKQSALNCLQQYKEELKSDKCKAEVHRRMERQSRDIRFDEVLANACMDDRAKFCNDVQMVRAGVANPRGSPMGSVCPLRSCVGLRGPLYHTLPLQSMLMSFTSTG